jgi:hypothetical protein
VVGIGVGEYDDPNLTLPAVAGDVAKITAWFAKDTHHTRYEPALPELAGNPTTTEISQALNEWLDGRCPDDMVVIYLAAHGEVSGSTAYVLGRNSPSERFAGRAISGEELGRILGQAAPHNALVIVDACVGGVLAMSIQSAAVEEARENPARDPYRPSAFAVLSSSFGLDPAYDGKFAAAFLNVVTQERRTGSQRPWISIDVLMSGLNDELAALGIPQVAERAVWGTGAVELIPNPNFGTRRLSGLVSDEELAAHFGPESRGVTAGERGSYFTGRHDELARIAAWLKTGGGGLLVVTGSPGSGKSALVSRVVVLSDPELRKAIPNVDRLDEKTVPPEGAIDAVIWCHNKSFDRVVSELADKLSVTTTTVDRMAEELLSAVADREPTIVFDALDEASAGDARPIATKLIRPLARLPRAGVLVATRPHPVMRDTVGVAGRRRDLLTDMEARPEGVIVLDRAANQARDMTAFVAKRLQSTEDGKTPYTDHPKLARDVAERITAAAGDSFLVAAVGARALAAGESAIDPENDDLELPSEVGAALAVYLDRFSEPDAVRDLLRPLAMAEGNGLPWGPVWAPLAGALADRRYDDDAISALLDEASDLIVESTDDGEPVYRLFHESLAESLRPASPTLRRGRV